MQTQTQKYVAELLGTFLLVFLGTASVVAFGGAFTGTLPGAGYLGIALTFGLTLVALVYTLGPVSGGHFNPAVTLGLAAARRFDTKEVVPYIASQVIGAILASAVLLFVTQGVAAATATHLGANTFSIGFTGAVVLEIILTFVLVWTVLAVTERGASNAAFGGLVIGLTLTVLHLAGIGLSGTGVNPARSLGPAIFAQWGGLTVGTFFVTYVVAPLVGGIAAAGAYNAIMAPAATGSTTESTSRA
jgi:aquaporin Z